MGAEVADTSLAMRPRDAAPLSRADKPAGRLATPASARAPGSTGFGSALGQNAAAAQAQAQQPPVAVGRGLLSAGVTVLLAETRTREASAKSPAPASFDRARDAYLDGQARVRETITANQLFAAPPAPEDDSQAGRATPAASPAPAVARAAARFSEEFEEI